MGPLQFIVNLKDAYVRLRCEMRTLTIESSIFSYVLKVCKHGHIFVGRCPRTKVRVRLTFTSYLYFCTMLNFFFVQTVEHSTLLVSCTKIRVRVTFSMKG